MSDKQENTVNIVEACISAAKSGFQLKHVRQPYISNVLGNGEHEVSEELRKLTKISTQRDVEIYASQYLTHFYNFAQEGHLQTIIFRDCYFDKVEFSQNIAAIEQPIVIEGCYYEAAEGRPSFLPQVIEIKNSYFLLSEKGKHEPLLTDDIDKCVFRGNITARKNKSEVLKVSNSVFENLSEFQGASHISACSMKRAPIGGFPLVIENSKISTFELSSTTDLIMKNTRVNEANFNDPGIRRLSLTNVIFSNAPAPCQLDFTGRNNVNFENLAFEDLQSDEALAAFRSLKLSCEKVHYEHGAIMFHGFELETYYNLYLRKNCESSNWPEKFTSVLHKSVSDYGRDVLRPFKVLFFFLLAGFIIDWPFTDGDYLHSALLSLKHTLGPLVYAWPGDSHLDFKVSGTASTIWAFFHTLGSSVLWFLIILMIRRRFKL